MPNGENGFVDVSIIPLSDMLYSSGWGPPIGIQSDDGDDASEVCVIDEEVDDMVDPSNFWFGKSDSVLVE